MTMAFFPGSPGHALHRALLEWDMTERSRLLYFAFDNGFDL